MLSEFFNIFGALADQDAFMIRTALRTNGAWLFGGFLTIIGGLIVMFMYKKVPFIDRHLEKTIMVWSYLAIAYIIFMGVIDRFIFNDQEPWSFGKKCTNIVRAAIELRYQLLDYLYIPVTQLLSASSVYE